MPPPAFDRSIPKPKQNKRRKGPSQPTSSAMPAPSAPEAPSQSNQSSQQATHPTSSAMPAPSLLQAPPPFSPIHTMPTPWYYHSRSLAAPPGGTAGPGFTSNGVAAMPPTHAPWNQGSESHSHQVMQRHEHIHQPWNYYLPTTSIVDSHPLKTPLAHHSTSPASDPESPLVRTFAMFQHYQLRTTTGSSYGGSRTAAGCPSSASQRTVSNSSVGSSRGSTPFPGGVLTSNLSGPGRTGSDYSNPPLATQPSLRSTRYSLRRAASDTSSIDGSVSAGVRRPRDTNSDDGNDLTSLSPQRIKRLKVHAKKLADDLQIPDKSLLEFIETGDLFLMLVDMKASLVKYELSNQTHQLQALQDTLSSKDFELGLHNRLLACLLSPNLTAYVTDTQRHIMDFIFEHLDVFKIPAGVFDDVELRGSLGRIVTKLLATIRSQLKSQVS
ncbi:hypothetical protein M404DRAFT_132885 [Pisolithus tinctorius Marx 270]|uniref:Uncharacterized protein n=1 Tax=Pisolithus tinctorius Marx 270 TaxID=870435 RepID=A0A0C3JID8_PISTI|nr:hypothetical protein M404DRAFT_132885 [Pisolithus tinctorius Marx 270]